MKKNLLGIFVSAGMLVLLPCCNAQTNPGQPPRIDRQPAVAGTFYPADKNELLQTLSGYFGQSPVAPEQQPLALIVPHAGYIYSGSTAAMGYQLIDRNACFKHIFIIGSSHTMYFNGASVYSIGDFLTPLGRVTVDTLAAWLANKYSIISNDPKPHAREHGIEVQLPFLQFWLKKPFSIVPIIVGGESPETCRKLAAALEPFFNSDNLFIISSDFSHYPAYEASNYSDSLMAKAIQENSTRAFLKAKTSLESQDIPGLVTAMCGWTSALTLLYISEKKPDLVFKKILHTNSGDTKYGDKKRVVGYNTLVLLRNKPQEAVKFNLTEDEKNQLLSMARNTIEEYISNKKIPEIDINNLSENLKTPAGAFVTLMEKNELRGCIGNFTASQPLFSMVQSMAVAASTHDPRFKPVNASEIKQLKIEISVLSPMKKIKSIDEIELGKHGIYIVKGNHSGTFLPQVANETHWIKEEFLGHCAQDKADIGWDGWKDADIYTYEALVFGEP